jgi:hypothetical protein
VKAALIVMVLATPAVADEPRGAFCEVTPCLPGKAIRRKLTANEPGGPVTCAKDNELGVDSVTKKLMFCTTAAAVTVEGIPIAAKSYTLFHPDGKIYQSHASVEFERTLATGTKVKCGAAVFAIDQARNLTYCTLAAPLATSPKPRVGEGISFHPNGKLNGMTLDEPYTAAGIKLVPGTHVVWDDQGRMIGGWAKDPITVGGLSIDWDFRIHPNGKPHVVQLAKETTIARIKFPKGADLKFRSDGSLEEAAYVSDEGFMIHGEPWRDTRHLSFDKAGQITSDTTSHWQGDAPRFRK